MNTTEQLLEPIANTLSWKPTTCQRIAVTIVKAALNSIGDIFPDEIDLSFVSADDSNLVGLAWKNLMRLNIIKHGNRFRRSTKPNSKGRTIFAYKLASRPLAITFLNRNKSEYQDEKQAEMF